MEFLNETACLCRVGELQRFAIFACIVADPVFFVCRTRPRASRLDRSRPKESNDVIGRLASGSELLLFCGQS